MTDQILKYQQNPILESGFPKYLFRGQNKDWCSIPTTFGRLENDNLLLKQAQIIYRYAQQHCGLFGYSITKEEGIAILQHYGLPTPSIDLTGNIEIALFFALDGLSQSDKPVIFVIDTERIPNELMLTEHNFLIDDISQDGLNNRWLRQDGYGIMTKNWYHFDEVRQFDLKKEKGKFLSMESITDWEKYTLKFSRKEIYDKSKDKIPAKLKSTLTTFVNNTFGEITHPSILKLIDNIDK